MATSGVHNKNSVSILGCFNLIWALGQECDICKPYAALKPQFLHYPDSVQYFHFRATPPTHTHSNL